MPGLAQRRGVPEGFMERGEELCRAFRSRTFGTVYRYVRNRADADDLCQEVMIRLARHADEFPPGGRDPGAWVYTTARNVAYDFLRRRHAHRQPVSLDALRPDALYAPDVLDRLTEDDLPEAVGRAMAKLPFCQFVAVTLMVLRGYSAAQAAGEMGVSREWAWKSRALGLAALERALRANGYFREGE
jgi:RNA polymerase sigma factor (sigma-70 family)